MDRLVIYPCICSVFLKACMFVRGSVGADELQQNLSMRKESHKHQPAVQHGLGKE